MVVELIHLMRVHNKIAGLLLLASFAFEREKDFDDHQVKLAWRNLSVCSKKAPDPNVKFLFQNSKFQIY